MSLLRETPCDHGECPYDAECYGNCEYWCGAEEPQDDPEVWEDEEYEDAQGVVGPDSYRTDETLIKAMDAAGWYHNSLESYDGYITFDSDYGYCMDFDSWEDVEDWLLGVVFDDPEVSDAVEKIMKGE